MLWAGSSPHTRLGHAQLINVQKKGQLHLENSKNEISEEA